MVCRRAQPQPDARAACAVYYDRADATQQRSAAAIRGVYEHGELVRAPMGDCRPAASEPAAARNLPRVAPASGVNALQCALRRTHRAA